jgi:predicted secreted protein
MKFMKAYPLLAAAVMAALFTQAAIEPTARGAVVETPGLKAEFRDGAVISIVNRHTAEEYIDQHSDMANVAPHLPGGLGSQHSDAEREAALTLYKWPWFEHAADSHWPNHHYADQESTFSFSADGDNAATLTYSGLTDGTKRFSDETFSLHLAIDAETGDLLVTPKAKSPRSGVYSSSLVVAPLAPAITAEAPIFDGMRLDRHMQPMLWVNQWGGYWDYALIAFNGYKRGAVAVWCQDAALRHYKYLHYLINEEGLGFSFTSFNIPPFDKLTEADGAMTWRIQAFDHGWSQAVARFREWRLKNVKIAPRPAIASQISFVNGGVNAAKQWVDLMEKYFDGDANLARTATFGATIRGEGFDQNHANNTPYEGFKEHMAYWKQKGCKMMAYLQPMIMWGPKPKNAREEAAVEYHRKADTITVFQKPDEAKPLQYIDQHHLGEPEWQRWFLDWVKEYIQDYGADAVYHDQSYHCPVDARGLAVGGMTSTEGMADYFYKAQTESPDSFHGTEHMTEVNNVGASLGIGSGILWGTAESMRRQRIDHPSPICNALHWPNGAIFSFPHYSAIGSRSLQRIHWGMNIAEGRGELPYAGLQSADAARTDALANERWFDLIRSRTFVSKGLRAVFPEQWDRSVLSYFRGAAGEDYRYVKKPWGTAFVEMTDKSERTIYGRIHGTPYARVDGGILGWPFYNAEGPAGLNPERYYVLDPDIKRPAAYFSSNNTFSQSLYEGFVSDGFADDTFIYAEILPRPDILNIITYDSVILNAPEAPKAVFVNGKAVKPAEAGAGRWKIDFQLAGQVNIVALLTEPPTESEAIIEAAVARAVGIDWSIDQFEPLRGAKGLAASPGRTISLIPFAAPANNGNGTWEFEITRRRGGIESAYCNGVEQTLSKDGDKTTLSIKLKAGEQALLKLTSNGGPSVKATWQPDTPPAE